MKRVLCLITEKDKLMVSTILSQCAENAGMPVEEFTEKAFYGFLMSYLSSEQRQRDFWAGFTYEGNVPTIEEAILWMQKKMKDQKAEHEEDLTHQEAARKAKNAVLYSLLSAFGVKYPS